MTNKKIFTVTLSVTIIHFILTSVIGHYIAVQVGTQMGKIVADGLIEAYEKSPQKSSQKSEEEATLIYQNMKSKSDNILAKWKVPMFLLSFPSKPITYPLVRKISRAWIYNPTLSHEISREQLKTRGMILDNIDNGINSLSFGLLIYLALTLINKYKLKHNKPLEKDTLKQ